MPALEDATEDEVLEHLAANRVQLWPGERSAFLTSLIVDPPRLHVWLGGGDLREMLSMIPGLAAWGRSHGAQFATVHGRKGWDRILKPHGFEPRDGELWKAL